MANRFMPAVAHSFGRKPRRFRQVFSVIGAADPVPIFPESLAAAGFASAVHTAAGKYTFVLADVWPDALLDVGSTYGSAAENEDLYPQAVAGLGGDGRWVITVRTKTGAANTDPGTGILTVWIELEVAP